MRLMGREEIGGWVQNGTAVYLGLIQHWSSSPSSSSVCFGGHLASKMHLCVPKKKSALNPTTPPPPQHHHQSFKTKAICKLLSIFPKAFPLIIMGVLTVWPKLKIHLSATMVPSSHSEWWRMCVEFSYPFINGSIGASLSL